MDGLRSRDGRRDRRAARGGAPAALVLLLALGAGAAPVVLGGCDLVVWGPIDDARDDAPVAAIGTGDHTASTRVGIAVAALDYDEEGLADVIMSGEDQDQVVVLPLAPVGRTNDDGDLLTDAERIDLENPIILGTSTQDEADLDIGVALAARGALLLAGSTGRDATIDGEVIVYSPLGSTAGAAVLHLHPPAGGAGGDHQGFGRAVALGDLDGDGFLEAIVGDDGAAWSFPGHDEGDLLDIAVELPLLGAGASYGAAVAAGALHGAGDGTDCEDAVGETAAIASDSEVVTYCYVDVATPPDPPDLELTVGITIDGFSGVGALAIANLAGTDGLRLVVGAAGAAGGGAVHVCALDAASADECDALALPGEAGVSIAELGASLAVGDLNADGVDDLIVGAPGSTVDGVSDAGAVVLYFGDGSGGVMSGADHVVVLRRATPEDGDRLGHGVAAMGDIDDDPCGEIAVAAPGSGGDSGHVFVFFSLGETLPPDVACD